MYYHLSSVNMDEIAESTAAPLSNVNSSSIKHSNYSLNRTGIMSASKRNICLENDRCRDHGATNRGNIMTKYREGRNVSPITQDPAVTHNNSANNTTDTKAPKYLYHADTYIENMTGDIVSDRFKNVEPISSKNMFGDNKRNIAKLQWWHSSTSSVQLKALTPRLTPMFVSVNNERVSQTQHDTGNIIAKQITNDPLSTPLNTSKMHFIDGVVQQKQNNMDTQQNCNVRQQSINNISGSPPVIAVSTKHLNVPHHYHQHHRTSKSSVTSLLPSSNDSHCHSYDNHHVTEDEDQISQDSQLLFKDPEQCVGLLNSSEDDEMQITGYKRSRWRTLLCWCLICITGGLLRLLMHWWRHWCLIATHVKCPLEVAEKVLIQEDYQKKHKIYYVKTVQELNVPVLKESMQKQENLLPSLLTKDGSPRNRNMPTLQTQREKVEVNEKNLQISLHFSSAQFKRSKSARIFNCKQLRYAWDNQTQSFHKLKGLDVNVSSAYFHQQKGLPAQEQLSRRLAYGPNEITIPYKDFKTLLVLEMLNPFYVFQIFSVILWFTYDYYYYACVILLMSMFGIAMSIIQTKKNQDSLRETVMNTGCALVVTESGQVREIPTECLVPGDIIEIPTSGCTMQCDAVLLSGNCILDESMLTGESVPVTKTPLPMKVDLIFDKKEHARHTLFCGTKVIQTRYIGSEKVLAIVINTGNITTKGGLIRSILYPPPVDYKFEQDSYKFIEFLGLIAIIGFVYTLITKIVRGIEPVKIAVESLDLITIVVPPALPAAMTVGRFYAQKRLQKKNIYCISPRSINVAGSIDCCCFDKTGTLTEEGLDMWGVVPKTVTNEFQMPIKQIKRLPYDNFLFGMATCHSITIMNGKLMGDPLDLKMFESTGWTLEDQKNIPDYRKYGLIHPTIVRQPKKGSLTLQVTVQRQSSIDDLLADVGLLNGEANNDHGIVREFPFTSNLQRMSVITRRLNGSNFNVYCKGSPEMLQQLCQPNSLPENYSQQLAYFAKRGYRIIAIAFKPLSRKMSYIKAQRLARESVECDLEFLGFVVLENRLKPDTSEVIRSLTAANIRTVMITGDNILTAISVARDCGIVPPDQAVVTVNVRHLPEKEKNIYELYYTLELGDCDDSSRALVNDTEIGSLESSVNNLDDISCVTGGDYQRYNGDVTSLSSVSATLPNSNSLVSVETFETWTHQDPELGLSVFTKEKADRHHLTTHDLNTSWRTNYRFAMVGRTWQIIRENFPDELKNFVTRGSIFARMSPEQKQALIVELQQLDYSVAMCGDGANDCGALKVAHTGISLSETESSIASPFTSRNATIACVPTVIKEGRAALVTSFGIFKYMAAYSMVQFISVMILYSIDSNLTDKQFLYIDLGLISVFAFLFGKTESYNGPLAKLVPLSSLISLAPLSSLVLHLLVVIGFQTGGWFQLHQQEWFVPFKHSDEDHLGCYENYIIFAISSFQYIILAFIFSKGAPYRKPIWSNIPLCLSLIINFAIVSYLVLYPTKWIADFFQLIVPDVISFRYWMLLYGAANFLVHAFVETFVIEFLVFKNIQVRREANMQKSNKKYLHVEYALQYFKHWPKITQTCEAFDSSTSHEETKSTYVEIRAEQSFDVPASQNNALNSFFGVELSTVQTLPTVVEGSVLSESERIPSPSKPSQINSSKSNAKLKL
ncbi:polyamine-transporting ATPase 13A3 isoform X2 [Anastrepha obliqua]|uniref:polyamine-transporting ATPase 13A3 isoform X2 n=1 Tax=Anastrepha obliqua TaxID=95512 RepID=UPI002408FCC9|nr:polyamine-transporting ATPase 13A3 isoform X2 [Anastrepha obliqua]